MKSRRLLAGGDKFLVIILIAIVTVVMFSLLIVHELEKNGPRQDPPFLDHRSQMALPLPLFVAVGQGTTGTHAMFDATCELGLPSVHFRMQCANRSEMSSSWRTREGTKHHLQLLETFDHIRRTCQTEPFVKASECEFERLRYLVHIMKSHMTSVVQSDVFRAIHDSPYTNLLLHLVNGFPGIPVIIITSERDPAVWSKKRITDHPMEVVCREVFQQALMMAPSYDLNDPDDLLGATFDMEQCLSLAYKRRRKSSDETPSPLPPPRYIQDVFVSYEALLKEAGSNKTAIQLLFRTNELAMKHYQDYVRDRLSPIYTINLWDHQFSSKQGRINATDIANGIQDAVLRQHYSFPVLPNTSGSGGGLAYYLRGEPVEEV